jgi:hypothetical protein
VIEIHSNWLDENGFPLPAGLKDRGYTGRLVKVSIDPATTNDPYDTQITEFPINPGKALQVLKFGEGEVGKYHYYLQVNGKTGAESNDFSTGNHTGVLRHRPNKYVPVKVPLFDETITNVNKILQLQNNPDAKGTNAAFDWVYRPELSFSVVDLEVSSILLHSNDPEDDPLELINSTDPVISTADSAVEIFYNLLSSQFDRITPLDGEQTFILAFGEEEIEITVNSDGTPIKFTNLEHLAEIKPEDYLSIRLYLNEDSQNVLWDWAFKMLDMDMDTDNNNGYEKPDRTLLEESTEVVIDHPGKILYLNTGDINRNKIPDFADFIYINKQGEKLDYHFTPVVIEIPPHVEVGSPSSSLTFNYQGSDPKNIKKVNIGTVDDPEWEYTPAEGNQRIWLKDGVEQRDPLSIMSGGHYIEPGKPILLELLGYSSSNRIKTFYIEALNISARNLQTELVYVP